VRILVVDDSVVMRSLLKQVLTNIQGIENIELAANGRIAVSKMGINAYDLVILDLEMPELDGLQTLAELKRLGTKARVMIFASETLAAARKTMEAFRLGAWEVLSKPVTENFAPDELVDKIRAAIQPKIQLFMDLERNRSSVPFTSTSQSTSTLNSVNTKQWTKRPLSFMRPSVIVIASSTGGPNALERIFTKFSAPCQTPILLVQHMPPYFTKILAETLGKLTGRIVQEASDKMLLLPGSITVAPGGYHMTLGKIDSKISIHLDQEPPVHSVRPAADPLFKSAVAIYGDRVVGIVLTGMGYDGRDGAIAIKNAGGAVIIQDQASSTVWGMPGSVFEVSAYDQIASVDEIGDILKEIVI